MAKQTKDQIEKKPKRRAAKGSGRLYKRAKDGKEYPPEKKVQGVFWLQYNVNGTRIKEALIGREGFPIDNLDEARAEQKRLTAPFMAGRKESRLQAVRAALSQVQEEQLQAVENARPVLPIATAWEKYLQSPDRPDTGADTLRYYETYWKKGFVKWLKDNQPSVKALCDITPQIASDYAASMNGGTVSPNTYNKHTAFLKLFFRVLEDAAGMKENPFEKTRRKNLKTNSRRELTIAELIELLKDATGDLQTLLYLGTFTGLRLGDCCTLKWGETDLDRGLIRRVPNKTAKRGKPVLIGIPAALHDKLSEIPPSKRKGYVLPRFAELYTYRNDKGRPTHQPDISNEIQKHFKDCGIQVHREGTGFKKVPDPTGKHEYLWEHTGRRAVVEVGFHSLRHTYASRHAEAGTPQAMIQANMGHGNPAMTAHYTHVNEAAALRISGALDLTEQEPKAEQIPDWIKEKFPGMTAKNWKQIKAELIGGAR